MLAFTDAWLPPPRPSSTVLHPSSPPFSPISGLFPTSCLHERRPRPVLLSWRRRRSRRPVPSSLLDRWIWR
ncbi:hypothetical protein EE612_038973 [Oryza sativa]|nr:hypothetical protein EE612_038973 [Oryza sativa]